MRSAIGIAVGRAVMPHLQRAYGIHRRLSTLTARSESAEAAIDLIRSGVVVLDSLGHVLYLNRAARQLVDSPRSVVRVVGGELVAASHNDGLRTAIAAVCKNSPHAAAPVQIERADQRPLSVSLVPVSGSKVSWSSFGAAAVVFIDDPEHAPMANDKILQQLYGVTPAEAKVALCLLSGKSVAECAEVLGVTVHTARTQLKQILTKTATSRQAELLLLLERTIGHHVNS